MEGHAAIPQLQYLQRVLEIEFGPVEEDVAEPAADQDAERRVKDHVVGMAAGHGGAGLFDQLQQIPPAEDDAGEIGKRIPAELEEAEIERDRIEAEARSEEHTSE